jgi:chemotaxis protein CheD
MARMGQSVISAVPGDLLVSLGLGSCIGLALIDASAGIAGLAHIVLPSSDLSANGAATSLAKHADTAVPALLAAMVGAHANRSRIEAVFCGGASMFAGAGEGSTLQIGQRNADATRHALAAERIRVRGHDTGGNAGRSIEVDVATGKVSVRSRDVTRSL